jgi:hypothetical protein
MKNYRGKEVKLVCSSTGVEMSVGSEVLSFRGERSVITSIAPPHKSSASGYVNNYYASVYNLEFVEL